MTESSKRIISSNHYVHLAEVNIRSKCVCSLLTNCKATLKHWIKFVKKCIVSKVILRLIRNVIDNRQDVLPCCFYLVQWNQIAVIRWWCRAFARQPLYSECISELGWHSCERFPCWGYCKKSFCQVRLSAVIVIVSSDWMQKWYPMLYSVFLRINQSVNQIKDIYTAPYVANKSEVCWRKRIVIVGLWLCQTIFLIQTGYESNRLMWYQYSTVCDND